MIKIFPFVCVLAFGFGMGHSCGRGRRGGATAPRDTLTVTRRDTVRITSPAEIRHHYSRDTVHLVIKDTIRVHDTLYMYLNREIRTYVGDDYRAQVSGIRPELDWVEVYPKTITQTITAKAKPKPWGLGVQVGAGVGKEGLTPYIGVGISYNFIRW